jgi:hypothetical protein
VNAADLDLIARLVKDRSGIVLTPDKAYLVESRLLPVLRRWQFASLKDLAQALRERTPEGLADQVVEAMTTNESFFFRDVRPFEQLREVVLPNLIKARPRAHHPHLERRLLQRPGALLDRDDPVRDGGARRLEGGDRRHRPLPGDARPR